MILQYNGKRKLFVYQNIDFATGKAEVADDLGEKWIAESNGTFTLWKRPSPVVKATPKVTPKVKPKAKPKVVVKSKLKK